LTVSVSAFTSEHSSLQRCVTQVRNGCGCYWQC